jgi:hypothetical protein
MNKNETKPMKSELILYQTQDGKTKVEVRLQDETVWLSQKLMAELFQTTPQNITTHLRNIFNEGELEEAATCKDFLQVQTEGSRRVERTQRFYNLDAIISVGYRIKSHVATRFRQWATQRLPHVYPRCSPTRRPLLSCIEMTKGLIIPSIF